jgi:hypothetical protein
MSYEPSTVNITVYQNLNQLNSIKYYQNFKTMYDQNHKRLLVMRVKHPLKIEVF